MTSVQAVTMDIGSNLPYMRTFTRQSGIQGANSQQAERIR